MQPKITDWHGIYDLGWGDLLCPESYSHPAKMARGLVFKIMEYLLELERIRPGQTIVDPFGGIGTTALPALLAGLNYVGVELEQKFVDLAQQNIKMWNQRFAAMPKWNGTAVMLQGDSRRLVDVVAQAGGVVSSPPYANGCAHTGGTDPNSQLMEGSKNGVYGADYGTAPGQLGAMPEGRAIISSPPYSSGTVHDGNGIDQGKLTGNTPGRNSQVKAEGYGDSTGQLSNLPTGDPETVINTPTCWTGQINTAVVSSPPWAGNSGGRGEASRNGIDPALFDRHQGGMVGGIGGPGNLAGLEPGEVGDVIGGVVSSPPYEACDIGAKEKRDGNKRLEALQRAQAAGHNLGRESLRVLEKGLNQNTNLNATPGGYGSSAGQLGTESGETFWQAARAIVEQCAAILPPGAPAVWVIKSFVRSGQIVDFPGQWQALCEACGFETVEIVRAWLVKDKGTQIGLNGEAVRKTVERKSFFRRIAERNGAPRIDYEIVLFTKRSESAQ